MIVRDDELLALPFRDDRRNQVRFHLCYVAILHGAPQSARALDVLRSEARILEALDRVSDLDPTGTMWPNNVPARAVRPAVDLMLAPGDRDRLQQYLLATAWAPIAARDVIDVIDWLNAATT